MTLRAIVMVSKSVRANVCMQISINIIKTLLHVFSHFLKWTVCYSAIFNLFVQLILSADDD